MSDHPHFMGATGPSTGRVVGPPNDEDADNEKLWQEFQNCAQTVTKLYQETNWRNLQTSATATTQLYKSALEIRRKAYEKGASIGRAMLAKEIFANVSAGGKIDLHTLMEHLYCDMGIASDERKPSRVPYRQSLDNEALKALSMFQQVLETPNLTASPNRSDLNNFLNNQVQRRKRQRSPPSPTLMYKKSKRC